MNTEVLINSIIKTFLLPPGISFMLLFIGLIIISRFYLTGKIFIISSMALLVILSLPITAQLLTSILEDGDTLSLDELKKSKAKAIVVLGAGRYKNAIEYEKRTDSISTNALMRLNYAVYLHKKSKIPLLLAGGNPHGRMNSEAAIMNKSLSESFNLKAKWLDTRSVNTWYNAQYSSEILAKENIKNIILVTHATHMPRAILSFEHFGLNITAAPLGFKGINKKNYTINDFLPSADAMSRSSSAMNEFIGYAWYYLRYKSIN